MMVLPAEPSKGQNRGGVVALTRFLGVEIEHLLSSVLLLYKHLPTQTIAVPKSII
jgi:hypothetical protein